MLCIRDRPVRYSLRREIRSNVRDDLTARRGEAHSCAPVAVDTAGGRQYDGRTTMQNYLGRLRSWLRPASAESPADLPAVTSGPAARLSASPDEQALIAALRAGDETAFLALVEQYQSSLLRLAMMYVSNRAVAEEVVQDTWLAVLQGINRFEARSSLKTWLFSILTNCAKTRARREKRTLPFSSVWDDERYEGEPAVDPARFNERGYWVSPPRSWETQPEERLLSSETRRVLDETIAGLPAAQQQVITMRDIEGWSAIEVCNALAISQTNQRVLLHRARSRVRRALEVYLNRDAD
jgi:RNA polymerase sigma-70 factor (ECF subfamily)